MTWAYVVILAWSVGMPATVTPVVSLMPRPEQVMAVPPALLAQLHQQVIDPGGSDRIRLERLGEFLFRKSGLGMDYSVDATSTVEQAYLTRKANCVTFTLLTVALARAAGLKAYGQELDDIVAGRVDENVVYRFNHVNAGIAVGRAHFTIDVARDLLTARSPPTPISDQRLLALYYNNRAAELLAATPPTAAVPYMAMALQLAPDFAGAWANAGVLQQHQGDLQAAERDYLKALALDPKNTSALVNLVTLYESNGDEVHRAIYARRLEDIRTKDPYLQYLQGQDEERQGDYKAAVEHYRRAVRLYDRDPRFYLGLAHAYQQLGEERSARQAMNRAAVLSQRAGDKP